MYLGMHASDVAVFDGLAGPELLHAQLYQGWWIFNVRFAKRPFGARTFDLASLCLSDLLL